MKVMVRFEGDPEMETLNLLAALLGSVPARYEVDPVLRPEMIEIKLWRKSV